jgi:hypothetical protein
MKKPIFISLFIAIFVAISCSTPNPKRADAPERVGWLNNGYGDEGRPREWDIENAPPLYGDVDSVTIYIYHRSLSNSGIDTISPSRVFVYHFNDRGDVAKREHYSDDSYMPYKSQQFIYDTEGLLAEMIEVQKSSEAEDWWKTTYKHNSKGLLVEASTTYKSDAELGDVWHYEYDGNGNKIHAILLDSGDLALWETFWKYDANGRVIEESRYNYEDAAYAGVSRYKYNAEGVLVEEEYFSHGYEEETKTIVLYSYDAQGNIVKESLVTPQCEFATYSYKYDGNGRMSETLYRESDGSFEKKICRKYDSMGNVVEEVESENNSQLTSITKYNIVYR